ncbi:MAG: LPS assembly protein LptD [bacterium]
MTLTFSILEARTWIAILATMCLFAAGTTRQATAQESPAPPGLSMPDTAEPVNLTADQVTWDREENLIVLTGAVVITHPDYRVEARQARAYLDENLIRAAGEVTVYRLERGEKKEILKADEVDLDTTNGTGYMVHARLRIPWGRTQFRFAGKRFQRIDEHTYLIEEGSFTWCDCEKDESPDWSVEADNIEADTEGDVVCQGARIHVRDVPVLALPYFRYPITTERKSGFLFPEIETSSSDGYQFELPYYWVISRSTDLTVMPRYIEERGLDLGAEGRYNYGDIARGELRAFGIDDSQAHRMREGARLIHRTEFGDVFTAATDWVYISDNEVLQDFDHRDMGDENKRALESRMLLAYHQPTMNVTAEFSVFDDLMGGDIRESPLGNDRDDMMVQRLPALHYTLLTTPLIGPLMFDLQGDAVNYWRQDVSAGRGQLFSLYPRLALPYRFFDAIDFWMTAGYQQWALAPDPDYHSTSSFTGRPRAELYTSAQWQRIYNTEDRVLRHNIRPAIVAYYEGEPQSPDDDFFTGIIPSRATELAGVHLDSRLWSRPADKPGKRPVESARLELTQLYDFERDRWRDVRFQARLGAPYPWRVYLDDYYSWENGEWSRAIARVGYLFTDRTELRLGYRYDSGEVISPYFEFESLPEEALTGTAIVGITPRHLVEYRSYYSLEYEQIIRQSLEFDYIARQKCWGMNLRVSDRIRPSDPEGDHEVSASANVRIITP